MPENLSYKLHGYLDLAVTDTGFVLPVFKRDDQLFIEIHFNDIITDFIVLPNEYLPAFTIIKENTGYEASTGDSCCYAFKWQEDMHYGTSKDLMKVFHTLLSKHIIPYYTERNIKSFIKRFGNKTSKPISILIVDDHRLIRETWSYILGQMPNYNVIAETGDGGHAIDLAKEKKPEIVLLDINMAPVDGYEALNGIKKVSRASKTIAVSMHSQPAYAKRILQLGGKGYVTKNSRKEEMYQAINLVYSGERYICDEIKQNLADLVLEERYPGINSLTEREIQIIGLICERLSSKDISLKLKVSQKTVELHRFNILKKLKLKNTPSLISFVNNLQRA